MGFFDYIFDPVLPPIVILLILSLRHQIVNILHVVERLARADAQAVHEGDSARIVRPD